MPSRGRNQGIDVLDEFVCQAIPAISTGGSEPLGQGRNAGMEPGGEITLDLNAIRIDATLKQLASLIGATPDPKATIAHCLTSLANLIATNGNKQ